MPESTLSGMNRELVFGLSGVTSAGIILSVGPFKRETICLLAALIAAGLHFFRNGRGKRASGSTRKCKFFSFFEPRIFTPHLRIGFSLMGKVGRLASAWWPRRLRCMYLAQIPFFRDKHCQLLLCSHLMETNCSNVLY